LGEVPPRSGRYGRLVAGILLYVGYANLLRLAEVWLTQGTTPAALGLWWVHAAMLTLALVLVARRQGRLRLPVAGLRA
jgi:lipopolysaccharide export system permease protein